MRPGETEPIATSSTTSPAHTTGARLLSATTVTGDEIFNLNDEKLGTIEDIMLDTESGTIRYVVMSSGGFLGMGNDLYALPWSALRLDTEYHRFILNVDADRLKEAPGFDKDNWPDMADASWNSNIESYYGNRPDRP